ncbi:MAG TPA: (Fe-S)-binding protein [Catalimonadaceae bacterium]|nr:(Fe-S)-binding protein [Catalimonadaceae bacterium]
MEVELFIPCFIDQLYPNVAFNMIKVLEKVGCTVFYNPNQTCCGQPAMNAGFFKEATEVAEKFLDDFTESDRIIVSPSASCVGMVCNGYEQLFKNSLKTAEHQNVRKRIHEFSDFLVNVLRVRRIEGAKLAGIATYHDSCSALRECNIRQEPRILLEQVEGLELVEMEETDQCCGFGGTFAAKFEAISVSMTEVKIDHMLAVKPDFLISTDSSCLLQYQTVMKKKGIEVTPMHLADVLASGW